MFQYHRKATPARFAVMSIAIKPSSVWLKNHWMSWQLSGHETIMASHHVLHGHVAPTEGIGPAIQRLPNWSSECATRGDEVREIIVATNPNLEGEATAMYIARQFQGGSVKLTRLARGLPVGGDLEYADEITLS